MRIRRAVPMLAGVVLSLALGMIPARPAVGGAPAEPAQEDPEDQTEVQQETTTTAVSTTTTTVATTTTAPTTTQAPTTLPSTTTTVSTTTTTRASTTMSSTSTTSSTTPSTTADPDSDDDGSSTALAVLAGLAALAVLAAIGWLVAGLIRRRNAAGAWTTQSKVLLDDARRAHDDTVDLLSRWSSLGADQLTQRWSDEMAHLQRLRTHLSAHLATAPEGASLGALEQVAAAVDDLRIALGQTDMGTAPQGFATETPPLPPHAADAARDLDQAIRLAEHR